MLNMDIINFRNTLDDYLESWADYVIAYHLAGLLCTMEDDYQGRNSQKIINEFLVKFRKIEGTECFISTWVYYATLKDLMSVLKDILMSIPEFTELNNSKENGEFIDLDAFFQNLWYALNSKLLIDTIYSCKKFDITLN